MIRTVTKDDVPAIAGIYNHYVLHSVITFDTEMVSINEMEKKVAAISSHFPYLVYEDEGKVAGYCYVHQWKEKKAYRRTLETTIYLSPDYLHRGIGTKLMQRLIAECRSRGVGALVACITSGNEVSETLHRQLGFEKVSHFRQVGEKFGRLLDVVDYELML